MGGIMALLWNPGPLVLELRRITLPRNRVNKLCKREQVAHGEGIRVVCAACLVADHGRLSHVCVVGQLREHKGRNIRP
jgi:hypothetical protein